MSCSDVASAALQPPLRFCRIAHHRETDGDVRRTRLRNALIGDSARTSSYTFLAPLAPKNSFLLCRFPTSVARRRRSQTAEIMRFSYPSFFPSVITADLLLALLAWPTSNADCTASLVSPALPRPPSLRPVSSLDVKTKVNRGGTVGLVSCRRNRRRQEASCVLIFKMF